MKKKCNAPEAHGAQLFIWDLSGRNFSLTTTGKFRGPYEQYVPMAHCNMLLYNTNNNNTNKLTVDVSSLCSDTKIKQKKKPF